MDEYVYDKYVTTVDNIKETIAKYGVAIVPKVLDDNECKMMVSGLWDYFEYITSKWKEPIDRDNKKTWRNIYRLYPLHGMLFQYFRCGHSQICWDIRQNEKIVDVFSKIWGSKKENMLVSFDGFSFGLPPEVTNKGWGKPWYHTDQSYTRNDFECIQSWVTGLDVMDGDATLGFMEGSNKYHKDFKDKFGISNPSDWYKLSSEEEKFYVDKGCKYQRIKCPRGSMVFWDSRTIHCGVNPVKGRDQENMRAIIYVCYQPRDTISKTDMKKKQKAFHELRLTSHYPTKIKLFGKNPRTYGGEIPKIENIGFPKLTDLGKRLAGIE